MRNAALFFLIIFASCDTSIRKENLLGTWTTVLDESKYAKDSISDRVTFFQNDSFRVQMFVHGALQDSFFGKYFLDEKRKFISTKIDTVEFEFDIIELSDSRLSTKCKKMKTISHYRKLK